MAQIVTITNPLTGQPAQVDQLDHTAQEIDDAIARALPGGAIDITLQNKADASAPDSYFLTMESGFSSGNSYYSKNQFNQVVVNIQTTADAGTLQGYYSWVKIGTLPVGFRPSRVLYFPAALDKTSVGQSLQGYVLISNNGSVSIRAEKSDSNPVSIISCAVFYAAS